MTESQSIAVDSNVVIAALLSWHQHHEQALRALQEALNNSAVVPVHVILESFSVLTRLPSPHRLSAQDAGRLLVNTFRGHAKMIGFGPSDLWQLVDLLVERDVSGGTTYDGVILQCARRAGADRLYTFNIRHFSRLDPEGIDIIDPRSCFGG